MIKIPKTLTRALIYLGVPAAIVGAVTAAWAITDYLGIRPVLSREFVQLKITVGSNQKAVLLMRWQLLEQRRKSQGLTASELVEYCNISELIGVKGTGCR